MLIRKKVVRLVVKSFDLCTAGLRSPENVRKTDAIPVRIVATAKVQHEMRIHATGISSAATTCLKVVTRQFSVRLRQNSEQHLKITRSSKNLGASAIFRTSGARFASHVVRLDYENCETTVLVFYDSLTWLLTSQNIRIGAAEQFVIDHGTRRTQRTFAFRP
jgi:hypothetical protein